MPNNNERFRDSWGYQREEIVNPRRSAPRLEDLVLSWLIQKRCAELGDELPSFHELLTATEAKACEWLDLHGEPEDEYELDFEWDDEPDWRKGAW